VPPLNPQGYAAALRWSSRHRAVVMRVPLRIALLAAIAVTSLASAAESIEFKLDVYCHNDIADGGGYSVQIRPGSSAETARVSVGADSRGVHFIETYDVSVRPSGSGTLFQNRHLTLMLGEGRPRSDGRIEYDATFTSEYGGRTIQDRLGCSSLQARRLKRVDTGADRLGRLPIRATRGAPNV
jgi:hypothetical protein